MIDDHAALMIEEGQQTYAGWPAQTPSWASRLNDSLMELWPTLLLNAALMLCVAFGLGVFALASYALSVGS
jgi:hypothetical protein